MPTKNINCNNNNCNNNNNHHHLSILNPIKNNSELSKVINNKKIIIYLHLAMSLNDGGATVQYYLANILDSVFNQKVFICNKHDNNARNHIFNKFINTNSIPDAEQENTVVVYCEGVEGNPLNAKYVVRWMLSRLGQNVPTDRYFTWNPNELVYFFNSEKNIINNLVDVKYLTTFYVNNKLINYNSVRSGTCFTRRKNIHKLDDIHPPNSFEITRSHNQDNYIVFFNKYEMFISYDPLSFLSIIALMCGCISIVVPIPEIDKKEYFKMTGLYDYMVDKNIDSIYGLAYGNSEDELNYSRNTLHLAKEQILDIQKWYIDKYVSNFINDINNWDNNKNTLLAYKEFMFS